MELTSVQKRAVNQLVNYYDQKINQFKNSNQKIVDFQAPTGSGKTFMLANTINEIIKNNNSLGKPKKLVFVIATLSSSELPIQMEQNLNEYKRYITGLYDVELKESPSSKNQKVKDATYNLTPHENKVFIFGASSFGKNRIFTEQGLLEGFIDQINVEGYTLIYIRDEAHHGGDAKPSGFYDFDEINAKTKLKDEARFEYKIQKAANFIIKMTATPRGIHDLVYIEENELYKDDVKLLKDELVYNKGISELKQDTIDDIDLLDQACKTFLEVKKEYANNNEELQNIRPAMLIQVENESKKSNTKTSLAEDTNYQKAIDEIINKLKDYGFSYVKYFANDKIESSSLINEANHKISLKEISKNGSNIDVIIFKIGPATGWNIPRACMLVQLRKISSKNLSVQTIGRIKRFPNPEYSKKNKISDEANKYYIYSNIIASNKTRRTLVLKKEFETEEFIYGEINKSKYKKIFNKNEFIEKIRESLNKNFIEDEFKKYSEEYSENNYRLVGEEGHIENKRRIYTWINNSIELELFVNRFIDSNRNLLNNDIQKTINIFFETFFSHEPNNKISKNMFWYIIIKKYINSLKQIYAQYIEKNVVEDEDIFELKTSKNLPKLNETFVDEKSEKNNKVKLNEIDNYAYKDVKGSDHYFDSQTETKFIQKVKETLLRPKYNDLNNKIKIYSKNPVFGGLKLEYFDTLYDIKSSYPDFIFKININNIIHYLYIEVKNLKSDYDPAKTQNIINNGYKQYLKNKDKLNNGLINNNYRYTFLVCYVDTDNSEYYFIGASDIKKLNNQINFEPKEYQDFNNIIANKSNFMYEISDLLDFFKDYELSNI